MTEGRASAGMRCLPLVSAIAGCSAMRLLPDWLGHSASSDAT